MGPIQFFRSLGWFSDPDSPIPHIFPASTPRQRPDLTSWLLLNPVSGPTTSKFEFLQTRLQRALLLWQVFFISIDLVRRISNIKISANSEFVGLGIRGSHQVGKTSRPRPRLASLLLGNIKSIHTTRLPEMRPFWKMFADISAQKSLLMKTSVLVWRAIKGAIGPAVDLG